MSILTVRTIIQNSGVAFGTSGARGLVSDMTEAVCMAYVQAFLTVIKPSFKFQRVALGIDLRPSSPEIALTCLKAIEQAGFSVDNCGALPTPALAYYAQQEAIPAVMVTGSHIPFDRNGIKFYRPDGEISKADEAAMLAVDSRLLVDNQSAALPNLNPQALKDYQQRYLALFPANLLAGLKIGLYEHSSVARDCLRAILEQLGARVTSLGRTEHFVPIDTEAVSAADEQQGLAWSREFGFDALVSTDGDGDRPLIGDEQGRWLRGDMVGLISASYLGVKCLAVPVNCNTAIEACGHFSQVVRTRIGSPYVIAGIEQLSRQGLATAGFGGNGGFLAGSGISVNGKALTALATRDAVLPILAVLAAAQAQKPKLSALLDGLPKRYTASNRLQNVANAKTSALLAAWLQDPTPLAALKGDAALLPVAKNELDGLRYSFADGEIIHLRGSGNAPELRCYCEADSAERAVQLMETVLAHIDRSLAA